MKAERLAELGSDNNINEQFDSLAKGVSERKRRPRPIRRPKGCPKDGRIVFHQGRIDDLPDMAYLSDVARSLGIKHSTLQQWCLSKKNPLPYALDKRGDVVKKIFRKDVLVEWLIATKRFTLKPEYSTGENHD